jgi:tetratricopeptide (TPR) repeat protein
MLDRGGLEEEAEIQALRNIVAAAAKSLGPKVFKQYAGHFWGFIETRPYMRARHRLAGTLRAAGRLEEAITECEAILALNPNDNQGVRYELLPDYLGLNRLEPARALLKKYNEARFSTVFGWCLVLERLLSDDPAAAQRALAVARKQNPHMQVYIKGHRDLPRQMPDSYAMGSKEEAICFAEVLRSAWARHPQALQWLAEQKIK